MCCTRLCIFARWCVHLLPPPAVAPALPSNPRVLPSTRDAAFTFRSCVFALHGQPLCRASQVGVFTGYSSLAVALALPPDGRLVAVDRDAKTMEVAKKYWQMAGVQDKVGGG